jgi:hypothetical protein
MRVQKQMFAGEFGGALDWPDLFYRRGGRSGGGYRLKVFCRRTQRKRGKMGFVK